MKKYHVIVSILLLSLWLSACTYGYEPWTPETGIWDCPELNARFTFGHNFDTTTPTAVWTIDESGDYVMINGDSITAVCARRYDSDKVTIICIEEDHPDFRVGEDIYAFDFVRLTDTEYVLRDETGKEYTFVRIGDTPPLS